MTIISFKGLLSWLKPVRKIYFRLFSSKYCVTYWFMADDLARACRDDRHAHEFTWRWKGKIKRNTYTYQKTEQSIQSIFQDLLWSTVIFFTLVDRASFPYYNNTKIIKFGWKLFILWVISHGLSFLGFARFPEFRGTINDNFSSTCANTYQHSTSYKEISVPMTCLHWIVNPC